jgi:hypothetical protein
MSGGFPRYGGLPAQVRFRGVPAMADEPFRTIIEPFRDLLGRADAADYPGRAGGCPGCCGVYNLFELRAEDVLGGGRR